MTESHVQVDIKDGGYAVVTICREPVNSMHLELWQQLAQSLADLEKNPKVRGIIYQSGLKKDVFTAGNDLNELYAPKTSAERYKDFWVTHNTYLARLYRSPLVTIAAVRGACPAGGCVLALSCDYRIMTTAAQIGLNEVALGIPVPEYWAKLMARTVGQYTAEQILEFGVMCNAEEALAHGLVGAVVSNEDLLRTAEAAMVQRLKSPDSGRRPTKHYLRAEFSKLWEAYCVEEATSGWKLLSSPAMVQALEGVFLRLAKKG